jgi:hypothetical protein
MSQIPFDDRMRTLDRVMDETVALALKASSKDEAVTLLKTGMQKIVNRMRYEIDVAREARDVYKAQRDSLRDDVAVVKTNCRCGAAGALPDATGSAIASTHSGREHAGTVRSTSSIKVSNAKKLPALPPSTAPVPSTAPPSAPPPREPPAPTPQAPLSPRPLSPRSGSRAPPPTLTPPVPPPMMANPFNVNPATPPVGIPAPPENFSPPPLGMSPPVAHRGAIYVGLDQIAMPTEMYDIVPAGRSDSDPSGLHFGASAAPVVPPRTAAPTLRGPPPPQIYVGVPMNRANSAGNGWDEKR